jgi:hypothetical protein
VTQPTVVTHTAPATSAPSKPVRKPHKKPAPPPVVYTRTHAPRDIPVWLSEPTKARSVSPQFFSISTSSNSSVLVKLAAAGVLAVALLLLGLAAIPEWAVRPERAHMVLAHWRVQIAASGLSALFAAAIVFLIGTSAL